MLAISRDMTQRRAGEQERARLLTELLQSQKLESLGNLAGGIAHEMNKASTRGGKMVKNILSFAWKSPAKTEGVDFNSLVREEVSLLEHTAPAGIRIELDLNSDLALIQGDPDALGGALMHLFVSAVQAMSESGVLTIRTRNLENIVGILVMDTGVGMPKNVLEKAIEPFFTMKPAGQGTGLGLATVHSLVKVHGGKLEITSGKRPWSVPP